MKKILAIITAALMLAGAASCGKDAPKPVINEPPAIEHVPLNFKEANVKMAEDFSRIYTIDRFGAKLQIFGELTDGRTAVYLANNELNEHEDIIFTPKEGEKLHSACINSLGRTAILTVLDSETLLYVYNSSGNLIEEKNLGELVVTDIYTAIIRAAGDNYVINVGNETLSVVDKELNYIGDVKLGGVMSFCSCPDVNGDMTLLLLDGENSCMARLDGLEITDMKELDLMNSSPYAMCSGNSIYPLIADYTDGLYGWTGSEWFRITDYAENTFSGYDVHGVVSMSDSEYIVLTNNNCLTLLSEREMEDIKMRKIINAVAVSTDLKDLINKFNSQNDEYKVVLTDHSSEMSYKTTDEIMNDMKLDIVKGDSPDLLFNFLPDLDPSEFYYDLRDFIDNDHDISQDDFVPGLLDSITFRGSVPALFPTMTIRTPIAKSKFVGEKENLTVDEFISVCSATPDDIYFDSVQMMARMEHSIELYVDINDYLDYENAECHFDSPDFVKMIKFIEDKHIGMTNEEYEKYRDSDERIDLTMLDIWNDDYVFDLSPITSPANFVGTFRSGFNEPATLLGYPGNKFGGRVNNMQASKYCILKSAKEPQGAWEFIKFVLLEEKNTDMKPEDSSFSVFEDRFEEQMKSMTALTYFDPDTGKEKTGGYSSHRNEKVAPDRLLTPEEVRELYDRVEYDSFTEEEAAHAEEYIRNCIKNTVLIPVPDDIKSIIFEELNQCYNSDRTAEETARIIQNRISIYMSERFG